MLINLKSMLIINKMTKLNLSSLGVKLADSYRPRVLSSFDLFKILLVFGGIIFIILLIFITIVVSPIFGFILFVGIVGYLKSKENKLKKRNTGRFAKLISDNNWEDNQVLPDEIMESFSLLIDRSLGDKAVKGKIQDKDFWMINDTDGALIIVDTKIKLPEAYFSSSVINSGPLMQVFDGMMKQEGLHRISLEGDFDDHFRLYIRPNSQIEVLSVVSQILWTQC